MSGDRHDTSLRPIAPGLHRACLADGTVVARLAGQTRGVYLYPRVAEPVTSVLEDPAGLARVLTEAAQLLGGSDSATPGRHEQRDEDQAADHGAG